MCFTIEINHYILEIINSIRIDFLINLNKMNVYYTSFLQSI